MLSNTGEGSHGRLAAECKCHDEEIRAVWLVLVLMDDVGGNTYDCLLHKYCNMKNSEAE
jgi:hypothetical protein